MACHRKGEGFEETVWRRPQRQGLEARRDGELSQQVPSLWEKGHNAVQCGKKKGKDRSKKGVHALDDGDGEDAQRWLASKASSACGPSRVQGSTTDGGKTAYGQPKEACNDRAEDAKERRFASGSLWLENKQQPTPEQPVNALPIMRSI